MKQRKKVYPRYLWIAIVCCLAGCSDKPEPEPEPVEVSISADKTTIKANGTDKATFTVTVNGKEATSAFTLTRKGAEEPMAEPSFSTRTPDTYTFYATFDGRKSNEITVQATEVIMLITVDKTSIKANNKDVAVFTVTVDGADVTSAATVTRAEAPETPLAGASFSTRIAGLHTFYATFDEWKSNEITLEATPVILTLSVDKPAIRADGKEEAAFTVTADGDPVAATIYRREEPDAKALDADALFRTEETGLYTFYALYDEIRSNDVTVEATYVPVTYLKQHLIMQSTSTNCPNCPLLGDAIREVQQSSASRIFAISLHVNGIIRGQRCSSILSGAIFQTANDIANNLMDNWPGTAVNLHKPVPLYANPATTLKYLNEAITYSDTHWPAQTGIAIRSQISGASIDFTVKVRTTETGQYNFYAFIVEDRVARMQLLPNTNRQTAEDESYIVDENYVHHNVATFLPTGENPATGASLGRIERGTTAVSTWSVDTGGIDVKRTVNLSNCRIVCYTLRMIDGKYRVDNVASCPVNGSVDYPLATGQAAETETE
jgi:hypothetical protein